MALFGVVAIAVVVLGQVPLVAFLSQYVALDPDADRPDPTDGYVTYGTTDARPDLNAIDSESTDRGARRGDDAGVRCPHCRAVVDVDAGYAYCGQCAGRLPDRVVDR
jgi:hypothetical protein